MKGLIVALMASALIGCVRTNTAMLDDRTLMISARGTGFDDTTGVVKAVLVRAASAAASRGYEYFEIISAKDATRHGMMYDTPSTSSSSAGTFSCAGNTCAGSMAGGSYSSPGYAFDIIKPGADVAIRFLHANEITKDATGVFKVSSILAQRN